MWSKISIKMKTENFCLYDIPGEKGTVVALPGSDLSQSLALGKQVFPEQPVKCEHRWS